MRLRRHLAALIAAAAIAAAALLVTQPQPVAAAEAGDGTGTITIVASATPDDSPDFEFNGCLGSGCSTFALDDDADPTLPDRASASDLAPGTYTVTQTSGDPWTLTKISCVGGGTVSLDEQRATIALTAGADVTCTFRNWAPWIEIVHDAIPGTSVDFTYTGCRGAHCGTFTLDDDDDPTLPNSVRQSALPFGTYTITQHPSAAWSVAHITCGGAPTIDVPRQRVTIVIDEPTDNFSCRFMDFTQRLTIVEDDLANSGHDFRFTSCLVGTGCGPFHLDDDSTGDMTLLNQISASSIPAATYTITQHGDDPPLTDLRCTSGSVDLAARRATITVGRFEHPTCTFTNGPVGG